MIDRTNDLIHSMEAVLGAIRSSEHRRKTDVDHLLCLSARHVSVVEFGRDLDMRRATIPDYSRDVLGVNSGTPETAAFTMVLASAVTALDLCASALWFWINPKARRHVSLERVQQAAEEANLVIPGHFLPWLHRTKGSPLYRPIRRFRNGQIHATVRQDAYVNIGSPIGGPPKPTSVTVLVGADPSKPPTHVRHDLIQQVAEFVPERWQAFWLLLA